MNTTHVSKLAALLLVFAAGCADDPTEVAPAPGGAGRTGTLGDSFVYEVTNTRTVSAGSFNATFGGTLALTLVGEGEHGARFVRGDIRAPRYTQTPAKDLGDELVRPFYFTLQPTGEMSAFRFSRGTSNEAAAVQRSVTLALQVVVPEDPNMASSSWQARERDMTGEYDAAYAWKGPSLHKEKLTHVPAAGKTSVMPGFESVTITSSADFTLAHSRWPKTATEQESVTATAGELTIASTTSATAKLVSVEQQPGLIGSMHPNELIVEPATDPAAIARARIQADQGVVGGRSFEDIMVDLRSSESMTRNHAQGRLGALIRLDAGAAAKAKSEIFVPRSDTNTRQRLIGALGAGGTESAQHELATLLDQKDIEPARGVDVLIAMALVKKPTAETISAVDRAADSARPRIASSAILASGSLIKTMSQNGAGDTSAAMGKLLEGLTKADSDRRKELYLRALGNTGDPRALGAIRPFLKHAGVELRAAATHGMRFMAGDEVDRAVIAALSDPETAVKKAALGTIEYRPVAPLLPAVSAFLKENQDDELRKEALRRLGPKKGELTTLSRGGPTAPLGRLAGDLLLRVK